MLRVTWHNLVARKVRLLLSAFAIVIGVAFVAGSLVFTDTMGKSFDGIIKGSTPDVTVRPAGSGSWDDDQTALIDSRTISAATVDELGTLDDAARVDGSVSSQTLFVVGEDGKLVGGTGAPTLSFNYNDAPSITGESALEITDGHAPHGADEVMLDATTAEKAGYSVDDTVEMVTAGDRPTVTADLVGIAEFGGGSLAGASLVLFDTPTAQDLFLGGKDAYNSVGLTTKPGVSQQQLVDEAKALLPDGLEAVTGDKVAKETQDTVGQVLNFLNIFLLVFAAIALVVGTFLIINTFSILVAQRSRELALLRALGASRRQVTRSVLVEALAVGFLGSTVGLALGFALAAALKVLFAAIGLDLSGTALVFSWRTVIVSYVVGLVVTLVAAYLPARRAARIAPVAAMRDDVALPESSLRRRMIVGGVLLAGGVALMTAGLLGSGGQGATLVGLGVFAILIAVALMSPVLGRPVLRLLGGTFRAFGMVGRLATQNSLRNPRRTAATASALMIGLALVTTMSILGASVNKSIDVSVQEEFTTDYLMTNPIGQPFSTTIADDVRGVDGVGEVAEVQWIPSTVDGSRLALTAGDPETVTSIFDVPVVQGTMKVADGQIALSEDAADSLGASLGDTLELTFPSGKQKAEVAGIFEQSNVIGSSLVPFSTVEDAGLPRFDSAIAVDAADGADVAAVGEEIDDVVKDVPTVSVQTQEEFSESQRASVDQLLYLIYALLGLAIVVAVLGIVNTLALSVIERTREVGLLRAVGLGRGQLRLMVGLESVAIAVLGAVLGVVMGLVFGIVLRQAIADQGVTDLAIPGVRLTVFVVIAAVVGVLAAVFPARRAAKLNVLRAIATE